MLLSAMILHVLPCKCLALALAMALLSSKVRPVTLTCTKSWCGCVLQRQATHRWCSIHGFDLDDFLHVLLVVVFFPVSIIPWHCCLQSCLTLLRRLQALHQCLHNAPVICYQIHGCSGLGGRCHATIGWASRCGSTCSNVPSNLLVVVCIEVEKSQ